jgi:hypothetical protein
VGNERKTDGNCGKQKHFGEVTTICFALPPQTGIGTFLNDKVQKKLINISYFSIIFVKLPKKPKSVDFAVKINICFSARQGSVIIRRPKQQRDLSTILEVLSAQRLFLWLMKNEVRNSPTAPGVCRMSQIRRAV